ncbi:hypothetical protein O6P43_013491 [Quillaja saponaria]|uniref:Uncharacterized protein n=1 Tax=Quillaja saponaria TaxID=32244 RepID=A0AAD7PPM6_QUISA|nr:hypothetical protein O6P43_013491 [Quillaja saponaria]
MELCIFKPPTSIMMMGFGLSEERSDPIIECKFFLEGKEDKFTGRQSKKKTVTVTGKAGGERANTSTIFHKLNSRASRRCAGT